MIEIYKLQQKYLFVALFDKSSYFIRLKQLGDIWLFNCFEGCQHRLAKHRIKISQIKKIIITCNCIENISGLLGLLSSISLNTATNRLDIYAPISLHKYILRCRKYSQTNFRYILYIHTILDGLSFSKSGLNFYTLCKSIKFKSTDYVLLLVERPGAFNAISAISYQIPFGPIYGYLKAGNNFILPDGFIAYSKHLIKGYYLGAKIVFLPKLMQNRKVCFFNQYTYSLSYEL